MKIYCEHLEEELRNMREFKKMSEQKMALIKLTYDQQLEVRLPPSRAFGRNCPMQSYQGRATVKKKLKVEGSRWNQLTRSPKLSWNWSALAMWKSTSPCLAIILFEEVFHPTRMNSNRIRNRTLIRPVPKVKPTLIPKSQKSFRKDSIIARARPRFHWEAKERSIKRAIVKRRRETQSRND